MQNLFNRDFISDLKLFWKSLKIATIFLLIAFLIMNFIETAIATDKGYQKYKEDRKEVLNTDNLIYSLNDLVVEIK
jgi:hypothetical protein